MSPVRPNQRYLLIALATPALLAIFASLWPLEPGILSLVCCFLGLGTFAALFFVRSLRPLLSGMTTLAILLAIATSNWPLRAAYVLSRPAFDRIAERVRAGDAPRTPCSIGLFRIRKAELYHNGIVCLWTDNDPAGSTGFVQTASDDLPFNLWSHTPLDDSWQFISED